MRGYSKTYYSILQIGKDSSPANIRRAFLRQSKSLHPDIAVHSGVSVAQATRNFQELNAAYNILKDPFTKMEYDKTLAVPVISAESKMSSVPSAYTNRSEVKRSNIVAQEPVYTKPPPEFHWAYPKEAGVIGLILVHYSRLSAGNKIGFCMLFMVFFLFLLYQVPLLFGLLVEWFKSS